MTPENFFVKGSRATFEAQQDEDDIAHEKKNYIGHVLSLQGVKADPEKVLDTKALPTPTILY